MKKALAFLSLAVILCAGIFASYKMSQTPSSYNGEGVDVVALYEDPSGYDASQADGVAAVIVGENNQKTTADNVVYSVVFNFRGYDTLGESFILIGAISGSMAILRKVAVKKRPEWEDEAPITR